MKNLTLFFSLFLFANLLIAQNKTPETVFVEGGTFKMGISESIYYDEFPVHLVTLNDFSIGRFEVTIEEYTGFCRTAGLDLPEGDINLPATNVSWEDAIMYCNWLSRLNRLDKCYRVIRDDKKNTFKVIYDKTANGYRLPTEAEWEYAARGGKNLKNYAFSGGNDANDLAWFTDNGKTLHQVGEKKPNDLGLYDMTGNAQEWVFDVYQEKYYETSPKDNPVCEKGGLERVSRGGNYNGYEATLRITKRIYNATNFKDLTLGFRVAKNK
ncbi:MAG: formylglycine-generating enzyme family protein [Bacteroidales bacterium]|nr:formylglycine-generating enzyme family protein [Bacteroidales bacterium]